METGPLAPPGARPQPAALEADTPRIVTIGIALWLVALVAGLVFVDDAREWVWTCVVGVLLGVLGLVLARRAGR